MFVTSKIEFSNSPIVQFSNFKCCIKAKEPFNGVLVLIHHFKKYLKPRFFYFKGILQHFKFEIWRIGELENWRIRFLMSRTG